MLHFNSGEVGTSTVRMSSVAGNLQYIELKSIKLLIMLCCVSIFIKIKYKSIKKTSKRHIEFHFELTKIDEIGESTVWKVTENYASL